MADHRINDRKGARSQRLRADVERLRAARSAAYDERSRLVAALARLFPSGVQRTEIGDTDREWHGCVYIDLPTGQASWHFQGDQAEYFRDLPTYEASWDGHTTAEKYERLAGAMVTITEHAELRARLAAAEFSLRELLEHDEVPGEPHDGPRDDAARDARRRALEYLESTENRKPGH